MCCFFLALSAAVAPPARAYAKPAPPYALALELLDEADFVNCRRECLRLFSSTPDDPSIYCIAALAAQGAGMPADAASLVAALTNMTVDADVRLRVLSAARSSTRPPCRSRLASLTGVPGRLLIAFYRAQIRPAIGQRCRLKPSCSEYALQTLVRHGWLGMPMTADRLIREPDVVKNNRRTVIVHKEVFTCDPVSDHDYWWSTRTRNADRGETRK